MPESIEKSRYGCNLHGALQTLSEINGVVPILHSNPGCGIQNYLSNKAGGSSSGYLTGYSIPNSNVYEKQVIFGGTSRLREQIKNTVKVVKGDLYVTISGCEAEMVGDDIIAMTQEIINQGQKAIYYKSPGFRGDQHIGYEGVIDALLTQLPEFFVNEFEIEKESILESAIEKKSEIENASALEKEEPLINIFGIVPKQDIYWQGNLNELERIFDNIGVKVNKLFGYQQGLDNWSKIPKANLNLIVSKWGLNIAEKLKDKYKTPYVYAGDIGLGVEEIEKLVKTVADQLSLDTNKVEEYLKEERKRFVFNLTQITEYYYDYDFQREVVIVGDESTVLRYAGFVTKYFGAEVKAAIITDYIGEEGSQIPNEQLKEYAEDIFYTRDQREIDKIIESVEAELILGSGLENVIAEKLEIPNYLISYPAFGKVIVGKSDVGYQGAVTVIEELSSLLLQNKL